MPLHACISFRVLTISRSGSVRDANSSSTTPLENFGNFTYYTVKILPFCDIYSTLCFWMGKQTNITKMMDNEDEEAYLQNSITLRKRQWNFFTQHCSKQTWILDSSLGNWGTCREKRQVVCPSVLINIFCVQKWEKCISPARCSLVADCCFICTVQKCWDCTMLIIKFEQSSLNFHIF